jgi:hypothetical protein
MALVIANRVQETTTTTGTGTVTLAGAASGFQSFAVVGNTNTTYYTITSGTDWEVGIGTYSTTGPTLARTTILSSSNANAAITLTGTSTVFSSYPAEKVISDGYGLLPVANGGTGQSSYTDGQLLVGNTTGNTLTKTTLTAGTNVTITNGSGSITINAADQYVGTVTSVGGTGTVNGITLTGTVTTSGSLTLGGTLSGVSLTSQVTGTLPVANGGTGATTLTANGVLYGSGASAIAATAVGTTGQVLVGNTGAAPTWSTLSGIGVTSFSAGTTGLTPSSATTGVVTLAGTLGVANGGTGATTLTSGYLLKGNGTSAVSASVVYDTGTNVGIGTSSPATKLDVNGDATFRNGSGVIIGNIQNNGGWYDFAGSANVNGAQMSHLGTLRFLTASTERMRIDSSGNVLINRSSYSGYGKLNVEGGADFTNGNVIMCRDSGNVGVGTASPLSRLDVREANRADSTNITNVGIYTTTAQSTGVGGTLALGGLFNGSDLAPFGSIRGGKQNSTSGNYDGYLAFQTISNGGVLTEKMRITSAGQLCVGRTSSLNNGALSVLGTGAQAITTQVTVDGNSLFQGFNASTALAFQVTGGGETFTSSSFRGPIFYDSNNTAYYVDPASTSNLVGLTVANTITGNAATATNLSTVRTNWSTNGTITAVVGQLAWKNYGNNHTIFDASQSTSPDGGAVNNTNAAVAWAGTYPTLMGWNGATTYGVRVDSARVADSASAVDFNSLTNKTGGTGTYTTSGDFRAPIFYDSNNTAYYVDPNSISQLYGLAIRGDATPSGTQNQLFLWDAGNTTTSAIGFKSNAGAFTNPTGNGDGYNTYLTMDGAGRGWVFRRGVGGTDFTAAFTSGWILNNGLWQAQASMRAPIFYDSDNTSYYLDPSSNTTSLRTNGSWITNSTSTWGGDVAAKLEYHNSRWYASVNTAFVVRSTTGSEVFWAYNTGVVEASNDFRAPTFYDSNNTAFYADMAGTSEFNTIQTRGGSGFRTFAAGSASISSQLYFADAGNTRAWNWQLDENNNAALWNYNGSSWDKRFTFTAGSGFTAGGSITALVDMRAPIFYDSDNTAYYVDPASGSVLGGQVSFAGGSIVASNGDVYARRSSGATGVYYFADGITKYLYWDGSAYFFGTAGYTQSDVSMRAPIFYDSNNTGFFIDAASTSSLITLLAQNLGVYDSGVANDPYGKIAVTRAADANNYSYYGLTRSGQLGAGFGIDTANRFWWGSATAGYAGAASAIGMTMSMGGTLSVAADVRAPIFYDSGNTAYYLDPAGTTALNINGQIQFAPNTAQISGNDTSSYGSIAIRGARSGWYGIHIQGGGNVPHLMFSGANGGIYFEGTGRWASYYNHGDNCWGFGGSATSSAYNIYCPTGVYSGGRVDGTIFYDSNNTAYFCDPNSISILATVRSDRLQFSNANEAVTLNDGNYLILRDPTGRVAAYLGGADPANYYDNDNHYFRDRNAVLRITLSGAGDITATGNVTAYSDIRIKDNVETIPSALDKLDLIRGVTYTRTDRDDKERRYAGVIAQEIEQVLPEAIFENEDYKSVDYNATIALLIQAVKELTNKVKALEAKEQ